MYLVCNQSGALCSAGGVTGCYSKKTRIPGLFPISYLPQNNTSNSERRDSGTVSGPRSANLHTPSQVVEAVPGQPTCCHPDREGNKARAVPACGVEPRHDSEGHFTQQGRNFREHNSAAGTHGRPDCEAAKELIFVCFHSKFRYVELLRAFVRQ